MTKIMGSILIATFVLLTITGCKAKDDSATPNVQEDYPNPIEQQESSSTEPDYTNPEQDESSKDMNLDEIKDNLVLLAKADLASRLNISTDNIQIISIETVTWPDTSLGVPDPDMMFAQVLTPGFVIELEANGTRYTYHTDQSRVVYAENK